MLKLLLHIIFFCFSLGVFSQLPTNGMIFNGTSNFYEIPDNSDTDLSGSFTLEAWINPCDTTGTKMIFGKQWCSGNNYSYSLSIFNGKLRWFKSTSGSCTSSISDYQSNLRIIRNNIWQHVAVVHTPTSISLYRNGLLVAGTLVSGSHNGNFKNSTQPLRIGAYRHLSGGFSLFFNGRMDEIRVWHSVRTSAQILSKYNSTLVGNETGLKVYHNMENVSNDTIFNSATSTGAANNGRGAGIWNPIIIPNTMSYPFPFSLGNDTLICGSGSLTLTIPTVYSSYLWNNGSTSNTRQVSSTGTYIGRGNKDFCWTLDTINVSFLNGNNYLGNDTILCQGDSILLDATTIGATYLWNDGSTDSVLMANSAGSYWVRVSVNGCQFYDTVNLTFNTFPIVNLGVDTLICGKQLQLDAGNPGYSFLWNNSSTNQTNIVNASGIHWVDVSNGNCITRDSISIDLVDLSFNLGTDTLICSGTKLTLSPSITASNYSWSTGENTSSINVYSSGAYYLTISDSTCSYSDTINVAVQILNPAFSASPLTGCSPLEVSFTDISTINFGSINSWRWDFGDGNSSNLQNPTHQYSTSGVYSVRLTVSSNIGCNKDTTISNLITVHPTPVADFSISPENSLVGEQVSFFNSSLSASSYSWHVNNIFLSNAISPSYSFSSEGMFEIKLIVSNAFGCSDTITKLVIVNSGNILFAPNSFTPDEDGINDEWKMYSNENIEQIEITIFNRWGEIIFQTKDISKGWDGKYLGVESPTGTYIWKAKLSYKDGEADLLFGHIELLR